MLPLLLFIVSSSGASIAGLPPSLKIGSLAACAPTTLESAEECLTKSLSQEDLTKLRDAEGSKAFRGALDCEIEVEWHLTDPASPMAKIMREKLGADVPSLAAGMIIQDMQMRSAGSALPWDQVRRDVSKLPPGVHLTSCPTNGGQRNGN